MPLFGPPNIDKLIKQQSFASLIIATSYRRDPAIRIRAIEALIDSKLYRNMDAKNFSSIILSVTQVLSSRAKNDPDPNVKIIALRGLKSVSLISSVRQSSGGQPQVTELASLIGHYISTGNESLVAEAVEVVSSFQNLRSLLPTSTELVRNLAAWLSQQISQGKLQATGPAVQLLVNLGKEDTLATILKQYPPATRLDFLTRLIDSQPASAARIAARVGYQETVPLLLSHLSHENPEISTALAALGAKEAIPPLLNILPVNGDSGKYAVEINALSKLGDDSMVQTIINRIKQTSGAHRFDVEKAILTGLGKQNPAWLTNALSKADNQGEWEILLEALVQVKDKNTVPFILEQANRYPMAEILPQVMGEFHDDRFAPFLVSFMSNPKAPGRQRAARALGFLSDSQIVPALIQAVHKKDKSLVDFAIEALEQQYKNKSLSDADKQLIIQTASQLKQQHKDSHSHGDEGFKGAISDCTHTDYQLHHDQGALIKI